MEIWLPLIGGLALLVIGAELLVGGAVRLAEGMGVSSLLIGLTIVGFGTSTPELVTSVEAALMGSPGIAVGNIVGSNIFNILVILGISALIFPLAIPTTALRRDGLWVVGTAALLGLVGLAWTLDRVAAAGLLALLVGTAAPAGAITGNYVEDLDHPYVGLVTFYDETGEFSHRCSGSLLTETVFLTAGHCTDGATTARVYFTQDAGANYDPETQVDPVSGYPETCAEGTLGVTCATSDQLFNYGFDDFATFPDTHDVGLVILDQPILLPEYGSLAAVGSLDGLDTRLIGMTLTRADDISAYEQRRRYQTAWLK